MHKGVRRRSLRVCKGLYQLTESQGNPPLSSPFRSAHRPLRRNSRRRIYGVELILPISSPVFTQSMKASVSHSQESPVRERLETDVFRKCRILSVAVGWRG